MKFKGIFAYLGQFRNFDKSVKLLLLSNLVASAVIGLSSIIQPLYLNDLGFNPALVGFVVGFSSIMSFIVLLPAGATADHYGKKRLLILSVVFSTLGFIVYAFFSSLPFLIIASALTGLSWGTFVGPMDAILTDKTKMEDRNYVFSIYAFLSAIGISLGSLIPSITETIAHEIIRVPSGNYRTIFFVASALSLVSLVLLLFVGEKPVIRSAPRKRVIRSWRSVSIFSYIDGLIGLGAGFFYPLLPLYLSLKFSVTETEIGMLLALSNVTTGATNLIAPKISEKIGRVATITSTQFASLAFMMLIPFSRVFYLAAPLYLMRTALMNISIPITSVYRMNLFLQYERASASSIITMAWMGAYAIGTATSGIIMDAVVDLPLYFGALLYALSTVTFFLAFRKRR